MKWDLTTGSARLELAMEDLRKAVREVEEHWDDAARRRFEAEYLLPLRPKVLRAVDGIHRLQEILVKAQRDCEPS